MTGSRYANDGPNLAALIYRQIASLSGGGGASGYSFGSGPDVILDECDVVEQRVTTSDRVVSCAEVPCHAGAGAYAPKN